MSRPRNLLFFVFELQIELGEAKSRQIPYGITRSSAARSSGTGAWSISVSLVSGRALPPATSSDSGRQQLTGQPRAEKPAAPRHHHMHHGTPSARPRQPYLLAPTLRAPPARKKGIHRLRSRRKLF